MKIKKGVELRGDCDFWYDLTDWSYISPSEILEDANDAIKVLAAIKIVKEFEDAYDEACEEQELNEEDEE